MRGQTFWVAPLSLSALFRNIWFPRNDSTLFVERFDRQSIGGIVRSKVPEIKSINWWIRGLSEVYEPNSGARLTAKSPYCLAHNKGLGILE